MIIMIVAYLAFIAYAAVLFVYAVAHDRPLAAIGILLSMAGLQFIALDTFRPAVAIVVAVSGLALVARDLFNILAPRLALAVIQRRVSQRPKSCAQILQHPRPASRVSYVSVRFRRTDQASGT